MQLTTIYNPFPYTRFNAVMPKQSLVSLL